MITEKELLSLMILMDDPDPVVREGLKEILSRRDEATIDFLYNRYEEKLRLERPDKFLSRENYIFFEEIKGEHALYRLSSEISKRYPSLAVALFNISKAGSPKKSEELFIKSIESLQFYFFMEIGGEKTAVENIELFNHTFFNKLHFKITDSGEPLNLEYADIDSVVLRRKGSPITIAMLYFLFAEQAGLPIYPLAFDSGFLPAFVDRSGEILFYLNIFKRGALLQNDNLEHFFKEIKAEYDPSKLKLEKKGAILPIYADYLKFIHEKLAHRYSVERLSRAVNIARGS